MPYLLGTNAIRRTIRYLEQGKLIFRQNVKVMTVSYNDKGDYHQGARDLVHWNLCQIQYRNPTVQVLFLKNLFPTPFIRCWLDTGEDVIMDVFNKTNVEIIDHLIKILGQPDVKEEQKEKLAYENLAKFGSGYPRHCMCEVPGQLPCPVTVQLPEEMTGKYKSEHNLWPKPGLHKD
ncbi:small ribosomal subunit protein mS25 [Parasteatoda tepidariorum]|uniref:Small ribosomal subunit protein mS25 n=1 Tax=Parasteatoda tepidariorum TaxID=114398 RepID=A0A2L2YBV0_PARTP|nr:probable 28S ribosomal protein S25, mitochondrial [Parasteatoda tepidariorum]